MPLCTTPGVPDVGVVGSLRVADRDEMDAVVEQRVAADVLGSVHGPWRVCTTGGPSTRQRAERRPDDPAVVVHDVEVVVDVQVRCGCVVTRRTTDCRAAPGSGGSSSGETSVALVREPPLANSVTSWPASTRPSASSRHDELDAAVAASAGPRTTAARSGRFASSWRIEVRSTSETAARRVRAGSRAVAC